MDKRLRNALFIVVMGVFLILVFELFLSGNYTGKVILEDNSKFIIDSSKGYIGDAVEIRRGADNQLTFNYANVGKSDLSNCVMQIEGSSAVSEIQNIKSGEKARYDLNLHVPEDFFSEDDNLKISIICDRFLESYNVPFKIITPDFDFILNKDFREENNLILQYDIKNYDRSERNVILNYKIIDLDGKLVGSGTETVYIGDDREYNLTVPFDKDMYGEFRVNIYVSDKDSSMNYSDRVFLPYNSITGYAIKEKVSMFSYMVFALILLALFFVGVRYASKKASFRELNEKKKYIKLDLT